MITYDQFINFLYYKNLSDEWVKQDMNIYPVAPFYRYLQALVGYDYIQTYTDDEGKLQRKRIGHKQSGVETVLDCANTFNYLSDPDNCPDRVFPFLFQSFGLVYNGDIENRTNETGLPIIYYQRKLLSNIGGLYERRGTIAGVRFLVRVLTGLEFTYSYERKEDGRYLTINLLLNSTEDEINLEHSRKVIEQFLGEFLPHYIHVTVGESLAYGKLSMNKDIKLTSTYALNYDVKGFTIPDTRTTEETS